MLSKLRCLPLRVAKGLAAVPWDLPPNATTAQRVLDGLRSVEMAAP